ncbi:MAG TPA: ABC transporter substrate-binding protein, partial [Ktedonobacteraceae bacterium]|nr:ABC transporter substrate-binding protein [Ktedonobacteraceae bacterium]
MTDKSLEHHANLPEKEKGTTTSAPSSPRQTGLPTGFMKRIGIRMRKFTRKPRPLMVVCALLLILAVMLPGLFSLGLLFRSASAPLIITMVTSYNEHQSSPSQGLDAWRGAKLYIDSVNQQGGVNGHQIQLQQLNDDSLPGRDRSIADQAIQSSSLLVLGPVYSFMVPKDINNIYSAKVPPDGQKTS